MSVWVVKPEEVKYDCVFTADNGTANPFWIKVKKRLTVGEQRRVMTAGWRGMRSGEVEPDGTQGRTEIQIDWKTQTFARTEVYLADWSLSDDKGDKIPIKREAIESLHEDLYAVIETAINAHVKAIEEEKKQQSGSS